MCGEKSGYSGLRAWVRGSPPHVRGKGWQERSTTANRRITPAYAGKRPSASAPVWGRRDHPRMCGEKPALAAMVSYLVGSPPHMRGKGLVGAHDGRSPGITPAYAGKRDRRPRPCALRQDHPRICGEKRSPSPALCTPSGSPPRMRGKRCGDKVKHCFHGITPAHAGKSSDSQ